MTMGEISASISRYCYGGKAYRVVGNFVIESDTLGTDSSVEVVGGSATGALIITIGTDVGMGNIGNIRGVTTAEVKSVVEAGVAGVVVNLLPGNLFDISTIATGIGETIEVLVSSLAGAKFGLDNAVHTGTASGISTVIQVEGKYEGSYGNNISYEVLPASSGVVTEFNLNIIQSGVVVQRHANLSMVPTDLNYFVSVINPSSYFVEVTDPGVGTRPTDGVQGPMTLGNDGLIGIVDADYIGTLLAKNGVYAFEDVSKVNLLAIPGVATPIVHNSLINYCELVRGGIPMAFIEGPQGYSANQIKTYVQTTATLQGLSECGALFWPWCKIANPNTAVYGNDATIVTPPSAIMMGRAAMTDMVIEGGIYQAPAGATYGVLGIVLGIDHLDAQDERKRDLVYPCRINPIRSMEGTPFFNDGERTLKESGMYPGINQKRGRAHIESELGFMLEYVRHLRTNKKTRREAARVCTAYLKEQTRLGAFNSDIPEEAFTVDVGDGINPPSEEEAKRLNINLSFIMAGGYEWVIVNISKKTL
jgi:hypothetical protein